VTRAAESLHRSPNRSGSSHPGRFGVARLRRWGLRGTALVYLGALIVLPVVAIIAKGFAHGFSGLSGAFAAPGGAAAIRLTLLTSAIAAGVNAVFGTLLAYVLVRFRFPGRGALGAIVDMPFAVPTLVTGVMLVALYGPNSPIGGFLDRHGIHVIFAVPGIVLALLFVTLPLVVRTVEPVLLELDPAEEEASHTLGAGGWTTFRTVVLPAIRPAIAGGTLLAFARAVGEFGAIVVVAGNIPGKTLTAPVFIFQLTSQFRSEQAAAIAALLFAISFVLVLVTESLVTNRTEGKR
jgi:sulfate transport system permease protein